MSVKFCGNKFCGDESCIKCLSSGCKPFYDPIGHHLVELRECVYQLNEQLTRPRYLKKVNKKQKLDPEKTTSAKFNGKKLPASDAYLVSIPNFPKGYPFKGSFTTPPKARRKRIQLKFVNLPSKNQIKNLEVYFIRQVLAQSGYYVPELRGEASTSVQSLESHTSPVYCLSGILHTFLENVSKCMMRHKQFEFFSLCDDLWGPLETTFQEDFKFHGINGLHEFYYEKFIKKHEILLEQCVNMFQKYEKIRVANQTD